MKKTTDKNSSEDISPPEKIETRADWISNVRKVAISCFGGLLTPKKKVDERSSSGYQRGEFAKIKGDAMPLGEHDSIETTSSIPPDPELLEWKKKESELRAILNGVYKESRENSLKEVAKRNFGIPILKNDF